ncbi:fungal-specific transcription factor domain-containing protein [Xylaria sp. FL1042]|nr:fungal-specific transcription factor domain-containing protein [Xylaria sp. FL1042]
MPTTKTKPKRSQVSRACDWCRIHRIKCDNTRPCQNCQARGGQCSSKGAAQVHTLPQAFREIEKLRQRVKELEEELENSRSIAIDHHEDDSAPLPPHSKTSGPEVVITINTPVSLPDSAVNLNPQPAPVGRRYWEGVYASPNNIHAKQFFGPSSLLYFVKCMEHFLVTTLQQPGRDHLVCFNSTNKSFAGPFPERTRQFAEPARSGQPTDRGGRHGPPHVHCQEQYLTMTQEEYFLGLFWQSYHNSMQILDEHAFREHYRSLCDMPGGSRKPLALVDIIVAICVQYGIARLPPQERDGVKLLSSKHDRSPEQPAAVSDVFFGIDDTTIAERSYYYRSQALLAAELENPTITTLQCHIFSAIYLCNASFQTSAHSMLGLAVRTAQTLGLHLEPDEDTPYVDRELRKRIWWTLQTIEIKTCMKLGRPLMTSSHQEMCSLPSDDYQLALLSSSTTSMDRDVTWLTYTVQNTKLVLAAHATHIAFLDRCNELLTQHGCTTIYEDHQVLEDCARFLHTSFGGPQGLQTWLSGVPDALKSRRKGGGEAYSTDCSAIEMEQFAPTWLQRHRLLLELLYHHLSINLFRPFITFPSGFSKQTSSSAPSASTSVRSGATPLAHRNAHCCVRHAIALTSMIYEALRGTDHLRGWHEAFQWQWDAAVSLVGFILSDPGSEEIHHDARHAIDHSIKVFDIFGEHFAMGTRAASVTRDLIATVDRLVETRNSVGLGLKGHSVEATGSLVDHDAAMSLLDGTMNMAYGLDSFGGVDFSLS